MHNLLPKKIKVLFLCFIMLTFATTIYAKVLSQLTPTVTITEDYTDNYYKTENNTTDQYTTTYQLGFSFGFLEKKHQLYIEYNPRYKDYSSIDENDGLDHAIIINGTLTPSKRTTIAYGGDIEITKKDRAGESSSSRVFLNGSNQLSKNTTLMLSEDYSRRFDQQVSTGAYNTSDTNNTSVGFSNQFGEKDKFGINYDYSFTEYENSNRDDFNSHKPSAFLSYWVTPFYGIDSNLSYETIEYDSSNNTTNIIAGDIKFIKKVNRHFDVYLKYAQTRADQTNDIHSTYHPSIGFDWQPDENSGVSLGAGVIFQNYDKKTNYDKEKLFIDFDIYRNFNFSRRGTFSVTGSSGYGELDTDAASLGYNIYYQAGCILTYKLTKRLSSDLSASYKLNQYDDPTVNREDNTKNLKAGLNWTPLKWMQVSISYEFSDFDTSGSTRNDYQENKGMISISLIPTKPIRPESTENRETLQNKVY